MIAGSSLDDYDAGVVRGRAEGRGEIIAGLLSRARAMDTQADTATTVIARNTAASAAGWLRGLAEDVREGRL